MEQYIKAHGTLPYSLVIGQRLVERYQKPSKEKPHTLRRVSKDTGVVISQDAKRVGTRPSNGSTRHGDHNEHGTAQDVLSGMERHTSDIPHQLRFSFE